MIRVLIVEDSPTSRLLLREMMQQDSRLQVVGEACDGEQAVSLTAKLRPDLVTMDVDLPRIDGLEATRRIMAANPTPIVIVSSLSPHHTTLALDALEAGAVAVMPKPSLPGTADYEEMRGQLIGAITTLAGVHLVRRRSLPPVQPHPRPTRARLGAIRWQVVALATSTGGPVALQMLLRALPRYFPVPILVVQHIAPGFIASLASWLGQNTSLHVKVAEEGERLLPGTVYLAPDHHHLGVSGRQVSLSDSPPLGGFCPSASYLFESAARAYGPAAVGVILTGMGSDGTDGLRALHQTGGKVIAQDESTSVVFGMPGSAIAAGLADWVLPLEEIPERLISGT